jgi:hypothetical protein
VLVLYITTTPTQKQAPNPKKVSAALQTEATKTGAGDHVKSKLLFILGIVVAHGAVGAGLWRDLSPPQHEIALSCAHSPAADPYFSPQRELFAAIVIPARAGDAPQP